MESHQKGGACAQTEGCQGKLIVYHSHLTANSRVRKLRCNACGKKHGKCVVPNEWAEQLADLTERVKNLEESAAKHATFINHAQ